MLVAVATGCNDRGQGDTEVSGTSASSGPGTGTDTNPTTGTTGTGTEADGSSTTDDSSGATTSTTGDSDSDGGGPGNRTGFCPESEFGDEAECYRWDPATLGHGDCRTGMQTCDMIDVDLGMWSECDDKGPEPEICDMRDNDCDGIIDDADTEGCPDG